VVLLDCTRAPASQLWLLSDSLLGVEFRGAR
jgi:hypothetical protein